jgi:hypothetical protein
MFQATEPHNAIYFDFDYFMSSALQEATSRANRLASLDSFLHPPDVGGRSNNSNTTSLSKLLSHVSSVFQVIIRLIQTIGVTITLTILTIIVVVPMWALASSLSLTGIQSVIIVAALGIGYVATIRKLREERDILIAFRLEAEELSKAYEGIRYMNREVFLVGAGEPEGLERRRMIYDLHNRAKVLALSFLCRC